MHKTIFTYSDCEHLGDMLGAASDVTRFLMEVSPAIAETKINMGLTDKGAIGLQIVLESLGNTIQAACVLAEK